MRITKLTSAEQELVKAIEQRTGAQVDLYTVGSVYAVNLGDDYEYRGISRIVALAKTLAAWHK